MSAFEAAIATPATHHFAQEDFSRNVTYNSSSGGAMIHGHYDVRITPAARKELDRLPIQHRARVEMTIAALADNPRPIGCLKLRGLENTYRLRVGSYRVLY